MRYSIVAVLVLLLSGCGDQPAPAPKVVEKKAVVEAKAEAKVPEAAKTDPNKVLAQKIKRALEDEAKIQAAGIDVTASDGAVTLWGTAASEGEKRRAAQAAAKVEGVKSVDNRLSVVSGS